MTTNDKSKEANKEIITLAHGAGGRAMQNLIDSLFLKAFGDEGLLLKDDQTRLCLTEYSEHQLAMTTDSYVVSPIQFPGGDIGKLAVYGTVNDLAVGGAIPLYLSAAFILEEGLSIAELGSIVYSMAQAAQTAKVKIVTGDTKVVERGKADKLFINTTGIGVIPPNIEISAQKASPGDKVIVNGNIGSHGAAVMLARGELGLKADIESDCAPLNLLIQPLLQQFPDIHCMRDATRGGVGVVLNELAQASGVNIELIEQDLPITPQVNGVCELLGLEPLYLANEGLAVFIVPEEHADGILQQMQQHPLGKQASIIGTVVDSVPDKTTKGQSSQALLYIKNEFGSKRILDIPYGIQLPRIC